MRELNKRKPREEAPAEGSPADTPTDSAPASDELHTLRIRVAELTAENTELRRQVAQLQAALPADSTPF